MWFETFSAVGGLGIAGFAILTEIMSGIDRQYSAEREIIREHMASDELAPYVFIFAGKRLTLQSSWIVADEETGEVISPGGPGEVYPMNRMEDQRAFAASEDGVAYHKPSESRAETRFLWWPSVLHVSALDKDQWADLESIEQRAAALRRSDETPFDGAFWPRVVFRGVAEQCKRLRRYIRIHRYRMAAISLTAVGWSGALIAAFWT